MKDSINILIIINKKGVNSYRGHLLKNAKDGLLMKKNMFL